ncbi:MAG: NAD(P)-dependent oxidoreductase [Gemmatimonadales bacterium]|nr:NAD(P)-dependent oxidoreductase [Gemmatimonadales bacterium]
MGPHPPRTEHDLEDLLSTPTAALVEAMRALEGDLLVLGASGKMGPSLARLAVRACGAAGAPRRIIAAGRFSRPGIRETLDRSGVETIVCDLFSPQELDALPQVENVIFMAGQKFGSTDDPSGTWATNTYLTGAALQRFPNARWVVFSTGNVYPMSPASGDGPSEADGTGPVGDYAQSALARERVVEFFAHRNETAVSILRLNYAVELRYGVLRDIADRVRRSEPIDLSMGYVNLIWQGDANARVLCALARGAVPPFVLNLTGPKAAVRHIAHRIGEIWNIEPMFVGTEADTALLSDPRRSFELFGPPEVTLERMTRLVADWVARGGASLEQPTHYQERHGQF